MTDKEYASAICDGLKHKTGPLIARFDTEDHITLQFSDGIQVTLDFDTRWCRIHRNWTLLTGLDMEECWTNTDHCVDRIACRINKHK